MRNCLNLIYVLSSLALINCSHLSKNAPVETTQAKPSELIHPSIIKLMTTKIERNTNGVMYRAYVTYHDEGGETLYLDRVYGEMPAIIDWTREISLHSQTQIRNEFKKLSYESSLGGCDVLNLRFKDSKILSFETKVNKKTFKCSLNDITDPKSPLICY